MTPRDYQLRALQECRNAIGAGKRRLILCAPTGAGKTFTASLMIHGALHKNRKVLCLVPKREHVDQFGERLDALNVPHGIIMAGRPYTPGASVQVGTKDTLAARALRRDKIPFPPADLLIVDECVTGDAIVLTDKGPCRIDQVPSLKCNTVMTHRGQRRILGWKKTGTKPTLEITTESGKTIRCTANHLIKTTRGWKRADQVQEGMRVLCCAHADARHPSGQPGQTENPNEAVASVRPGKVEDVYDLEVEGEHCFFANGVLVHNCHLSMAKEWIKLLTKLEDQNPELVTIGLSATPARATGRGLGTWYQHIVYCSNYKELKDRGVLVPARIFTFDPPNLKGIKVVNGEWEKKEIDRRVNKAAIVGDVLRHWEMYAVDRSTIGFAQNIAHSIHLTEVFQNAGHRWEHLDANTDANKRAEILAALKSGDLQGVWQCDVLSVGHDFPIVSCIVLAGAFRSFVRYRQRCGRGGRCADGKKDCLARGTKVLTDKGEVKIEDVTIDHKLWDGVSWVSHSGAICRGVQPVITYNGITATPDHKVMTNDGWQTLKEASRRRIRITRTAFGGKPVWFFKNRVPKNRTNFECLRPKSRSPMPEVRQNSHESVPQHSPAQNDQGMSTLQWTKAGLCPEMALSENSGTERSVPESEQRQLPTIRRARHSVPLCECEQCCQLGGKQSGNTGEHNARPGSDRQQRALRTRKSSLGVQTGEYQQPDTEYGKPKEVHQLPKTISQHQVRRRNTGSTNLAWTDGRRHLREVPQSFVQAKREVWDILNAGPLQRFTANGRLVHNCIILDHVGAYLYHQVWPDEDHSWTLEEKSQCSKDEKQKAEENREQPIMVCEQCNCTFRSPPPKCPECGWMRARRGQDMAVKAGLLKEVKLKPKERVLTTEDKIRIWHKCLAIAANKGWKASRALGIYKGDTGELPWQEQLPNLPGPGEWHEPVADLFPQYVSGRRHTRVG